MPDIYINGFQIGSWDSCFYITSLLGVIWFPLYYYFVYDSPAEHPRITDEEYEFIVKGFLNQSINQSNLFLSLSLSVHLFFDSY